MPVLERSDTARISWEANGPDDGQAVLLIMGLAYPAAMWFRLMPALTERYRVIRVDNRGAGHTGDVPGAPYTVETMAADCLAVLDAADVRAAHVVGISMGGLTPVLFQSKTLFPMRSRSPRRWRPRTRGASSTATSSPRTSRSHPRGA